MCRIAEYLADQRDFVRFEALSHDLLMRRHREALPVLILEDFALTMVGKAALLGKADRNITEKTLADPSYDRKSADESWAKLAKEVLIHLRKAQQALQRAKKEGFDVEETAGRVRNAIDCVSRTLLPAENTVIALGQAIADGVKEFEDGEAGPVTVSDIW